MSRERTLKTALRWHDSRGGEIEADVSVTYCVDPGYAGDRVDPPQSASVEIVKILAADGDLVPARFDDDDDLKAECLEAWIDDQVAAGEARAEQRRDDMMMDRL